MRSGCSNRDGGPTPEERDGPSLLNDLTEMTGGRSFTVQNLNELAGYRHENQHGAAQSICHWIPTERPHARRQMAQDQGQTAPSEGTSAAYRRCQKRLFRARPTNYCSTLVRRENSDGFDRGVFISRAVPSWSLSCSCSGWLRRPPSLRRIQLPPAASPQHSAASAGYNPPGQQDQSHNIKSSVDLVVLHVTVTDEAGQFVPDLKQDDFRVFENKIEQKISVFSHEDIPVTMGLVIDNSGSMREKREQVNAAAMTFVQNQQSAGRSLRREFQRRILSRHRRRFHQRPARI